MHNFLGYVVLDYPEVSVTLLGCCTKVIQGTIMLQHLYLGDEEKKGGGGEMPLTLGFLIRSVIIASLYKIQCALENKRCFQPCFVLDH